MQTNAFTPMGPTYAIDDSAASQCPTTNKERPTAYRIANTTSSFAYIAWGPTSTLVTTAPAVGTPQGGVNSRGILGMIAGSVEVFCLPPEAYFQASTSATFQITPGEGM